MLEGIEADEMHGEEVRLVLLDDVLRELRVHVITLRLARVAQLAPFHLLFDGNAELLALLRASEGVLYFSNSSCSNTSGTVQSSVLAPREAGQMTPAVVKPAALAAS
jgi:hypothetical protein